MGLAIGLLIWAFFACEARNRNVRHSLEIEDSEKGTFRISSSAMGNFVTNIVKNFPGLTMTGLKMVDTRLGLNLNISLTALPDSELLTLRKELRELLFKELAEKLGIADKIQQINFEVVAFETPSEEGEGEN
ncbi:MAG: hypothetical protein IJS15_09435 [Victivallales bacterium]|nr:hypothetical protein [Victivallales bacterium]